MSKQLTLFECRSDTANSRETVRTRITQSPNEGNSRQTTNTRSLQDNTVFVDRPTSSTTVVINDSCSLAFSLGVGGDSDSELSDSNQDCAQNAELVQDGDAANAHPELMPTTQATSTRTAGDVPTDIAAGPDQTPMQPNIKFPATLKGNKHRSFRSEWYKRYRWLEYSRERDAAYCYPCRLFTTEPGKYWETFTKTGFSDWKYAIGKDGIIPCHDCCKTHMQAICMVSWQEYANNKESGTSVANRLDAARFQLITKNWHYLKTILEFLMVCSQQEIALRGHDEPMKLLNKGNFLEILKLISSHDGIIK